MPDSWDNLIMSLSHVSKLDVDSVIASLGEQALVSEGRKNKFRQINNGRKVRCFYCDKVGHIKGTPKNSRMMFKMTRRRTRMVKKKKMPILSIMEMTW